MNIQKIPNQIIKEPLQPLNLSRINAIALHHMAHPTAGIKEVEGWHISQGWRALGYNFWVGFDGTVYEGRGFNLGAGVLNQNDHIISVGFQGDYHSKNIEMPNAQFNSGVDIVNYVKAKVPTAKIVGGHRDFMATACPGQYFPLNEMKSGVKRGGSSVNTGNEVNEKMTKQEAINILSKFLESQTITYLDSYRYGDQLIIKLAEKCK